MDTCQVPIEESSYMNAPDSTRDIVVGVYDAVGDVARDVAGSVEGEMLIAPVVERREEGRTVESEIYDKDFFLGRSTHVVIVVTDVSSMAYLAGALNRLFVGSIRGVMAISQIPLTDLLESIAVSEESSSLHRCIEEGRCLVLESFSLQEMSTLLSIS
jgi:hypothetical protein